MAKLTFRAVRGKDNTHTVTRSTGDGLSTAAAALIVDNTLTKLAVKDAIDALLRHWSRQSGKVNAPADITTSGSDVE